MTRLWSLTTAGQESLFASEGFYGPRWSQDGRYLVAQHFQGSLMLHDFVTAKWEKLATGDCGFPNWSRDGQYVYFGRWEKDRITTAVIRIRMRDRKEERIGFAKWARPPQWPESDWIGWAPDDSMLVLRNIAGQEIYAFDWETP